MLHHISLGVADLAVAAGFYDAVMGALGYRRVFEHETAIGYGLEDGKDKLCLKLQPAPHAPSLRPGYGVHYYAAFVIDPDGHHIEAVINDLA
ncbi:MAG: VOC family protein [Ramlibacter sp.]|nr:VOC family protein [Ramlibacter sp.]